jgi:3'(2'), 5'-bisphosphate nucleotidase
MNFTKLTITAINAAIEGGKAILDVYHSADFEIESKADNSPLTKADKNAHNVIAAELEKTNIPILSEEGSTIPYDERSNWEYFWLVDPLDGTKEFIKRNGEFTVNIALIHKDTPMMGVIYVPVTKTLYFGDINTGAYKSTFDFEVEIIDLDILKKTSKKLPYQEADEQSLNVVASRSHMNEDTENYVNKLKEKNNNVEVVSAGSSLKLCLVAEGKADIYPRFGPTMEWDTGAGHAIAASSGAIMIKHDKSEFKYNKENLLNPYFIVARNEEVLV